MLTKRFKRKKKPEKELSLNEQLIEKCPIYHIPCDAIRSNTLRSRSLFDEDKLINLAYSIKHYGIIEPLRVRETDAEDSYDFELITGERRLRAARLAGFTSVPCYILNVNQELSSELSITENISSEPLNYFELAVALERLIEYGDSVEALASRLSLPQGEITKKLWLLELSYDERQRLLNSNISEKNAVAIAQISDKARRAEIIDYICTENMSENAASEYLASSTLNLTNSANSVSGASASVQRLPRDVNSAIKGITSRVALLNRHKKRADLKITHHDGFIVAEVRISLKGN